MPGAINKVPETRDGINKRNLNQIQRTSNHNSPVEENKSVKIYNSHWRLSSTNPVVFCVIIWKHVWHIIINLVQNLSEEVKEKEYFVAVKCLEVSDL